MPRQSLALTLWQNVTKETIFQASTDLMMSQQGWWQEIEIEIILGVVADELEHEPVGAWQGEQPLPPGTRSRSSLQTMHCVGADEKDICKSPKFYICLISKV